MYDDRLEILSPGRLPNTVTLDNMHETRYSRNPRIARTLVEFGLVRELNEGVKRIYTEMQRLLLNDPVFSEPDGTKVQLTLDLDGLGEYEIVAVQAAYARGRVTPRELSSLIDRSTKSSSAILRDLDAKGVLAWHGTSRTDPAQYYSLS